MKTYMYILEVITNLHMGDGDVNFNIVDNEVERDPVMGWPVMNSSGIKGALKEHFKTKGYNTDDIFGKEKTQKVATKPGIVNFYNGNCLALAMRNSGGDFPFSVVTTRNILENFGFYTQTLLGKGYGGYTNPKNPKIQIEGYDGNKIRFSNAAFKSIDQQISYYFAMLDHADFEQVDLPVIARNELKNGTSNNLWYEEYVPHHSVFYTFISSEEDQLVDDFDSKVNGQIIQFGANASIGQGLVKWIRIDLQ